MPADSRNRTHDPGPLERGRRLLEVAMQRRDERPDVLVAAGRADPLSQAHEAFLDAADEPGLGRAETLLERLEPHVRVGREAGRGDVAARAGREHVVEERMRVREGLAGAGRAGRARGDPGVGGDERIESARAERARGIDARAVVDAGERLRAELGLEGRDEVGVAGDPLRRCARPPPRTPTAGRDDARPRAASGAGRRSVQTGGRRHCSCTPSCHPRRAGCRPWRPSVTTLKKSSGAPACMNAALVKFAGASPSRFDSAPSPPPSAPWQEAQFS